VKHEFVAVQFDVGVLLPHAWQLDFDDIGAVGLDDVSRRHPRTVTR
jgi:hypothetical protein